MPPHSPFAFNLSSILTTIVIRGRRSFVGTLGCWCFGRIGRERCKGLDSRPFGLQLQKAKTLQTVSDSFIVGFNDCSSNGAGVVGLNE